MVPITWIMHTLAFGDDDRVEDMKAVIKDRDSNIIECKGAFGQYDLSNTIQMGGGPKAIIAYGSCNFMKYVTSSTSWVPGHWCDWNLLKCTNYMAKLAPYSLHHTYAYITFGELKHKWMEIYEKFSERYMDGRDSSVRDRTCRESHCQRRFFTFSTILSGFSLDKRGVVLYNRIRQHQLCWTLLFPRRTYRGCNGSRSKT